MSDLELGALTVEGFCDVLASDSPTPGGGAVGAIEGAAAAALIGMVGRLTIGKAGFEDIEVETVGNLARAWGRHLPTFALGLAGDLIAQGSPSRRSTILAVARKPAI